jgi:hypothetical protein
VDERAILRISEHLPARSDGERKGPAFTVAPHRERLRHRFAVGQS